MLEIDVWKVKTKKLKLYAFWKILNMICTYTLEGINPIQDPSRITSKSSWCFNPFFISGILRQLEKQMLKKVSSYQGCNVCIISIIFYIWSEEKEKIIYLIIIYI